ncbi:hypothetical protein [Aeromonas veronii]|uniref:hypothetical protein n=1 Tax=Aeromonas veronii TaxID=654 RepID=UPI0035BAD0C5
MKSNLELQAILESVFSWILLASISIITSGWFLAHPISNTIATDQKFVINLIALKIQATGSQVILGFAGFIITTLLSGVMAGQWVYTLVKDNFGIDPGQFKSICMFSSFLTVAWSFAFFIIYYLFNLNRPSFVENKEKYESQLERLSSSSRGKSNGK